MGRTIVLVWGLAACGSETYIVDIQPVDVAVEDVAECDFEPVRGAPGFRRYTCNPVLRGATEAWAAQTTEYTFSEASVLGHAFYQAWYTAVAEDGTYTIGMAASADGTTWEPHPDNPGWTPTRRDGWDGGKIQSARIAWDREQRTYHMLYGGIGPDYDYFGVGLASSPDGVHWEQLPTNPVLSALRPHAGVDIAWPLFLEVRDGEYEGLFAADDGSDRQDLYSIVTSDITQWDLNPPTRLLRAGSDGSWDDEGFLDATAVTLGDDSWLFYVGFGDWTWSEDDTVRTAQEAFLGVAHRRGREAWRRVGDGRVPLHVDASGLVSSVNAQVVGSRVHLWVSDAYPGGGAASREQAVGYFLFEPEAS